MILLIEKVNITSQGIELQKPVKIYGEQTS